MKKREKLYIRICPKLKKQLMEEALNLGFYSGKTGKLNFSRYVRWIIREGNRPIDRKQYDELIRLNLNLIKLGGLSNQYLYHLNRERKILLDKGIEENNKKYLGQMGIQNEHLVEIKSLLLELQKISHKIYILENG